MNGLKENLIFKKKCKKINIHLLLFEPDLFVYTIYTALYLCNVFIITIHIIDIKTDCLIKKKKKNFYCGYNLANQYLHEICIVQTFDNKENSSIFL